MVVSKKKDVRLNEILDAAEVLFATKGYEGTTVNDILHKVNIGKGTFYYYFESKEEVMNRMIQRVVDRYVEAADTIVRNPARTAHEKFAQIILGQSVNISGKKDMVDELHQTGNAVLHHKSLTATILALSPLLGDIVCQGIEEGTFRTAHPYETIELLLTANQFLFDQGIFGWKEEEIWQKILAFIDNMELLLGTEKGSFAYIAEAYCSLNGGWNEK